MTRHIRLHFTCNLDFHTDNIQNVSAVIFYYFIILVFFIIFSSHFLQKDGIGGSYRLASLDRLATRQRILEQNGGLGTLPDKNGTNGTNGTETNGSITHSVRIVTSTESCVIQAKRK